MSRVSIYLNFQGQTEDAFTLYANTFGTQITGMMRFSDVPAGPDAPSVPDNEKHLIMHAELPIMDGTVLMATDMLESMGHEIRIGNNTTINLEFDDRDEAERVYAALSEGGGEMSPLAPMFWGWWGVCLDKFGIRWMFNAPA